MTPDRPSDAGPAARHQSAAEPIPGRGRRWRAGRGRLATAATFVALLATVAAAPAGRVLAASPVPSASAEDFGAYPSLEVWLDRAPASDAPAGTTIALGFTIWDSHGAQFAVMNGLFLKLHPATGSAPPTEAETRPDAPGTLPGHMLANVIVPAGGPGAVEVVVRDQTDLPIHVGGVGPPPGAPLSSLVGAQVHLPTEPAIAGRPTNVVIDVRPQVEWDPPLSLPDRLVVIASLGRGPDLANAEIRRAAGSTATYAGPITIPEAGDVTLVFAFPGGTSGPDDIIQAATTRLKVETGSASPGPVVEAPATDEGVPWLLAGGAIVFVVAAGFVISRVFADL